MCRVLALLRYWLSGLVRLFGGISQPYKIATLAGGAPPATPVTAINTSIGGPQNAAADSAGNVYFSSGNAVFKLSTSGNLTLFAGNSRSGYTGDGGQATLAQLNGPTGIALDATGDVYISDSLNNVVRMVNPAGIISTFAGNGVAGYSGDGGGATAIDPTVMGMLTNPMGLAVDKSGNLYIADNGNHAVRQVNTGGIINTFAGNQIYSFGYAGDGAAATAAQLDYPTDVAIDSTGNVLYRRLRQLRGAAGDHRRKQHPYLHAGNRHQLVRGRRRGRQPAHRYFSRMASRSILPATCTSQSMATIASAKWREAATGRAARSRRSPAMDYLDTAAMAARRVRVFSSTRAASPWIPAATFISRTGVTTGCARLFPGGNISTAVSNGMISATQATAARRCRPNSTRRAGLRWMRRGTSTWPTPATT